jgi:DNA-binding response OmpR family regulator
MNDKDRSRILVVDDELAIRFFVSDCLSREGWLVDEADSGEAALDALKDATYDVMLLDLRMAGVDGLAVMRQAKERWSDTVIVVMTAYATLESAIEAVRLGAFDYLVKPCDADDIVSSVNRALEKKSRDRQRLGLGEAAANENKSAVSPPSIASEAVEPAADKSIQTGELIINLRSRHVSLANQPLALTPTEFELLAILTGNLGQPVSLERLIQAGLGYDGHDPQAVESLRVHISRLRRKLGANYILTVRGGGYMLANLS